MRIKILITTIVMMVTINSCTSRVDSVSDIDYLSKKQVLTLEEKDHLYPAWNISIRYLKNNSKDRAFTAEQKKTTLRILSVVRFVLNTPEYETNFLKHTNLRSRVNKSAKTTSEKVVKGTLLDSKRVLRTVQRTQLETEIDLHDTYLSGSGVVGLGSVPGYYPYLEDPYHEKYSNFMKQHYKGTWIGFSGKYNIVDNLNDYVNIGNTILHESVHNLGFTHGNVAGGDTTYAVGDTYSATLRNKAFLEKYKDEFKRLIPYFEEKYAEFITTDPAVKSKNTYDSKINTAHVKTHSASGEALTILECITGDDAENYIKPYRYVVKNGQRTVDDFILK